MGFWPLRATVGLGAVVFTLVPVALAALHLEAEWQADRSDDAKRSEAFQELQLFETEIAMAANEVEVKPESSRPFYRTLLQNATRNWLEARDDWRSGQYANMTRHLVVGHDALQPLLGATGGFPDPGPEGWRSDAVGQPTYPVVASAGAGAGAVVLWFVWAGLARRPRPAVPVPVFPGERELPRPEPPEEAPSTAVPGLGGRDARRDQGRDRRPARPTHLEGTSSPENGAGDPGSGPPSGPARVRMRADRTTRTKGPEQDEAKGTMADASKAPQGGDEGEAAGAGGKGAGRGGGAAKESSAAKRKGGGAAAAKGSRGATKRQK